MTIIFLKVSTGRDADIDLLFLRFAVAFYKIMLSAF